MKLGKGPAKKDIRTIRLARVLHRGLPAPLPEVDLTCGIKEWGLMKNDELGDCTIAGLGHGIQVWTANTTGEVTLPDETIVDYYSKFDGYVPGNEATDQGGIELDVLNKFRQQGIAGHELIAYADPDPMDLYHVKQALSLFGGLYIGVALPMTAQDQAIWDVVGGDLYSDPASRPGSWGGHAVFVPAYTPQGPICITWGRLQPMTWKFWISYVDEVHALLAKDWLPHFGDDRSIVQPLLDALSDIKN